MFTIALVGNCEMSISFFRQKEQKLDFLSDIQEKPGGNIKKFGFKGG